MEFKLNHIICVEMVCCTELFGSSFDCNLKKKKVILKIWLSYDNFVENWNEIFMIYSCEWRGKLDLQFNVDWN